MLLYAIFKKKNLKKKNVRLVRIYKQGIYRVIQIWTTLLMSILGFSEYFVLTCENLFKKNVLFIWMEHQNKELWGQQIL